MDQVMCVFGSEPAEHDFAAISLAVLVSVFQVQQSSTFSDVSRVRTVGDDTGRNQQPIGKDGVGICSAVAVRSWSTEQ